VFLLSLRTVIIDVKQILLLNTVFVGLLRGK